MAEILTLEINELMWELPNGGYKLTEFIIKRKGIWEFHANDKDFFPSIPHGHNKETGEKLDVYNGLKYNPITKQCTGKLNAKVLSEIQLKLKERGLLK